MNIRQKRKKYKERLVNSKLRPLGTLLPKKCRKFAYLHYLECVDIPRARITKINQAYQRSKSKNFIPFPESNYTYMETFIKNTLLEMDRSRLPYQTNPKSYLERCRYDKYWYATIQLPNKEYVKVRYRYIRSNTDIKVVSIYQVFPPEQLKPFLWNTLNSGETATMGDCI